MPTSTSTHDTTRIDDVRIRRRAPAGLTPALLEE
jgi:maltooligosyltrehalose synthase